jgi:hypothetical protein
MAAPTSRLLTAVTGLSAARLMWIAVAVSGAWAIGDAMHGRSSAVVVTVSVLGWLLWGAGVVALVVPSTLGLTVMRMLAALATGASVVAWIGGASPGSGATFVGSTLVCSAIVGGAELGQRCVQASAYGDEQRFLLRPPAAFLLPVGVAALLWIAVTLAAPLALASRQWIAGVPLAGVCIALTWLLVPRFNALCRRWLVLVPAGLVVHDQVVLSETLMVPRALVDGIDLALAGTEAADLTGPAAGHAVEVSVRSAVTAILSPTRAAPRGTALHMHSFIVAPSRPGAVLRAVQAAMPPPST